jgi:hypothetical protein
MATVKAIGGILAIILVVYACFQIAPPMMANYSFQDDLRQVVLVDSGNYQKTDDDIRNDALRKAREHDLPIDAKQITVQHIATPGLGGVYVSADYSVTVSLPGYSFDMHFTPNSGNR